MQKQYYYSLDFLKGIACIFVVFLHCEFPGLTGIAVQAIGRFCVPFFFMVSGYFCYKPLIAGAYKGEALKIKKKVLHIGKITLYASLFYLAFVLLQHIFLHNQNFAITRREWALNWLVFNEPKVIAGQYWFLFALLYAYIFYGILEYFNLRKFSYVLMVLLFVVYFTLAQGCYIAGITVPNLYYRNWLVEAFAFFMLGHWIHEYQEKINVSNRILITIIVVFTLLCWVERWLLGRDFGVNFCTVPQVFALFVYAVKNPDRHEGVIQRLGRDCSMLVYIFHPAVWHSMDSVYRMVGISKNMPALFLKPIFVLIVSILVAVLFNCLVSHIQTKRLMNV